MKARPGILAFNRGIVSPLALARTDIEKLAFAAETQTNWMPRVLGSMMLRPGLQYIGASKSNNQARYIPFIYSATETALVELTDGIMRVWVGDALVTRASVSATITNGTFTTNLTGWTDADDTGGTSAWATGGYLSLTGDGSDAAKRQQQVTVTQTGTEHALRIVINRGPVVLRVGSTAGDDDYVTETELKTGIHSLTFTPAGNFHIEFSSRLNYAVLVDSVAIESAGTMEITAPWAEEELAYLRYDQSGDVIFVACDGYQQRRIERRSETSWSLVNYEPADGPFRGLNTSSITLTPSGLSGAVTLTASAPLFKSGHAGALFRITSTGQVIAASLSAEDTFSDPIRVTGSGSARNFTVAVTGTWSGTLHLQRSASDSGPWANWEERTENATDVENDELDNQIIYYRIGFETGDYTSGTASITLSYTGGTSTGIVRIASVSSSTSAAAVVLTTLGGTDESSDWEEGAWSDYRGYPSAVALFDGRLWWAGKDNIWGSVSDAFDSFDDEEEGDSGPISRTLGSGPIDTIHWLLPLQRLLVGTDNAAKSARASSLDEPLTPTNFGIKNADTQGSARIGALAMDKDGLYVQRSRRKLHQMTFDARAYDYGFSDLNFMTPEIAGDGFTHIAIQRQPDTRVHCVREDGKVAVLIFDTTENVLCWVLVETDGIVEDVAVLPSTLEDAVYYSVRRTIDGAIVRYLEKWALEDDCVGGTFNKQADAFILYSGASTTTLDGLDHLEGETVVIWGDGADLGTATVSGGEITLSGAVTNAVVGLPYTAQYKSAKLAYAAAGGSALCQPKRINYLGLILANTHAQGIQYGRDFDNLDDMPLTEDWVEVDEDYIWGHYDREMTGFDKEYTTDARLCLQAFAPRPCTVLAAVLEVETHG